MRPPPKPGARPASPRPSGPRPSGPRPSGTEAAAYRLLLEYDGSKYQGWQRQGPKQTAEGVRTVAGSLEHALREAGFRVLTLMGSGRTDAGVHALGQVAHLHLEPKGAPEARDLIRLVDPFLPHDLALREAKPCSLKFHARHDAEARSYLYQLSRRRTAFGKPYAWWVKGGLDLRLLDAAWKSFLGNHDLSAFADLEPREDGRCAIQSCEFLEAGSLVLLRVTATHFFHRQVRRMVGASVACALGKAALAELQRDIAKPTAEANLRWGALAAPAAGLFLERVRYGGDGPLDPLHAVIEVR
ncbi:MAG: tRNA pseudouridine(38-40) synthase TruA [Holophagaceae bacterium]|nr:tRNA pseudouridine(38-40) synthase TruA [Holophagaceae bacterium]